MPLHTSIYELLRKMDAEDIVLAYKGEINHDLLDSVYSMMDKHFEEKNTPGEKRKKFFHILIEALQNVFHHQIDYAHAGLFENAPSAGFVIKSEKENSYRIITGNYILRSAVEKLQNRIDELNKLTPTELKTHYQQSLAGNEFSEKGGAGLGIIEMARKSGKKINYEFTEINDQYSFFTLEISLQND